MVSGCGVVDGGSCTAADFETTGSYNVAILAGGMYLAQDYHANATISRPNVTSNAACARCMASAWSNRAAYVHCFAPLVTTVCSVNETLALYSALHAAHGYFATASSGSQLPVMNIIAVSSGNFTISVSPQCELCFAFADQYSLHVGWIAAPAAAVLAKSASPTQPDMPHTHSRFVPLRRRPLLCTTVSSRSCCP